MIFYSINPHNAEVIGSHHEHTVAKVANTLSSSETAYTAWSKQSIAHRVGLIQNVANALRNNVDLYARTISLEMGKPLTESRAEIYKCAWVCDYYAEHAAHFLADEVIATDAQQSFVRHDPIGCVLAIMPWNFPFYQVFRFAVPTLLAGNTAILKHATNVLNCANSIENIFLEAGFPEGVFQNLIVDHDKIEGVIAHSTVKAVTLTGSGRAGSAVAAIAGQHIKKSVLELGGSNAFIVFEDADIEHAVQTAVTARMLNCGQSCIAAKRFILVGNVYDKFVAKFVDAVSNLKTGDPLEEDTQVGPLARLDLADELQAQVQESIRQGALCLLGGLQNKCYHDPTVLGEVTADMAAFNQETFGPLAAMIRARDVDHAFELSELSPFGLGVTVCTTDVEKALTYADRVSDGAYFVNELVKSDPRLPFGGTKQSGYGRELCRDGMMEFVNRKTVFVK
ncbi:MAG: NAD-dependent succinate-semialdehyde dehydrogenase [Ignavibacteria bacterium]|nr:NAD-dependent succinate-semialdehyde dehydrogenase [Ignavibacteria bacterium]